MVWTTELDQNHFDGVVSEHIVLCSEPAEDEGDIAQQSPTLTNCQFAQPASVRQVSRRLTIFDEQILNVCIEQAVSGKKQYQFNLAFLDPTPDRLSGIAWRWLYASIALAVICAIAFGLNWTSATALLQQRWLPLSVLLAAATAISFLVFVYRTRFSLTFHSLHGRAPLLEMAAHRPDRSSVQSFVIELQRHIESARNLQWKDKPQFLRDELRAHYRLWEEGVLPDDIYEASKVRILAAHG